MIIYENGSGLIWFFLATMCTWRYIENYQFSTAALRIHVDTYLYVDMTLVVVTLIPVWRVAWHACTTPNWNLQIGGGWDTLRTLPALPCSSRESSLLVHSSSLIRSSSSHTFLSALHVTSAVLLLTSADWHFPVAVATTTVHGPAKRKNSLVRSPSPSLTSPIPSPPLLPPPPVALITTHPPTHPLRSFPLARCPTLPTCLYIPAPAAAPAPP